jgi:hypothetical protein
MRGLGRSKGRTDQPHSTHRAHQEGGESHKRTQTDRQTDTHLRHADGDKQTGCDIRGGASPPSEMPANLEKFPERRGLRPGWLPRQPACTNDNAGANATGHHPLGPTQQPKMNP